MKAHSQFTRDLIDIAIRTVPGKLGVVGVEDIIRLSSMGVNPEGGVLTNTASGTPQVPGQRDSGFRFGAASERELIGVNPDLVRVTRLGLRYSSQDYCVYDGIRSVKEQQQHFKTGTTKTMQSRHLQGLAVDLVPWINGKVVWDWDGCYEIACAIDKAATELGLAHRITWGGAWDRTLADFSGKADSYKTAVEEYKQRHHNFIDGPHFQITPN